MSTVRSKDGTTIGYDRLGSGAPLLLIDGALCSRSFGPMPKLSPLLAKHFTVFTYDRRGRGESGDKKPYAVRREVEDLDALIGEAGGPVRMFGISSGATLAIRAAAMGLKINKLALYEPPFVADEDGRRRPMEYERRLTDLIESDRRGDAVKYFMTTMVGIPSFIVLIMQLMPMWSRLKALAHTLPYDAAVMGDYSVLESLIASVKASTLIAGGDKSPKKVQKAVRDVSSILPYGTLRWLKNQTHNVKAEVLAPVLVDFFKS
jgi:pimeloyl-ACP methyl ester carboxylesterase